MKGISKAVSRAIADKLSNLRKRNAIGLSWLRMKRLKHDKSNSIKTFSLFGKTLYYTAAYDLMHSLEELFVEEVYSAVMPPAPYIIDCGANIGLSILYLKRAHPDATIVAFEPDKQNFNLLQKNVLMYQLEDVTLLQKAVWNEDTILSFQGRGDLGSSIARTASTENYNVDAVRLKPFINKKIDLLKIDIEGAEYEVILDIADQLHHVERMFLEYHSTFAERHKLVVLLDIVCNAGFDFYIKEGLDIYPTPFERKTTTNPYDIQLNIFCFRKELAKALM